MKKQTKVSMTKLADAAFKRAAQEVLKRAEDTGTPAIVWENGAVKAIKVEGGKLKRELDTKKGGR